MCRRCNRIHRQAGYGPVKTNASRDITRGEGLVLNGANSGIIYGYAALTKSVDEYRAAKQGGCSIYSID